MREANSGNASAAPTRQVVASVKPVVASCLESGGQVQPVEDLVLQGCVAAGAVLLRHSPGSGSRRRR